MKLFAKSLLMIGVIQSYVGAVEGDQAEPGGVDSNVQVEVTKPMYVQPAKKERCDVWVQMSYENAKYITDTKLKILDSKPPGIYDDEALEALLSFVSDGHHSSLNSRMFVRQKKDGRREHIFTYFKGCKNWDASREKPNKSFEYAPSGPDALTRAA